MGPKTDQKNVYDQRKRMCCEAHKKLAGFFRPLTCHKIDTGMYYVYWEHPIVK